LKLVRLDSVAQTQCRGQRAFPWQDYFAVCGGIDQREVHMHTVRCSERRFMIGMVSIAQPAGSAMVRKLIAVHLRQAPLNSVISLLTEPTSWSTSA